LNRFDYSLARFGSQLEEGVYGATQQILTLFQ